MGNLYSQFQSLQLQRVSDGAIVPVLDVPALESVTSRVLVLVWPQLGDFDSVEYAGWLQREQELFVQRKIVVRAIAIGDLEGGKRFCHYTGFPAEQLFLDPVASIHQDLGLYPGLTLKIPGLSSAGNAWANFLLMCAGIGSPGTLREVFRGYLGDRSAPQLIADDEVIHAKPLPPIRGRFFQTAGGSGFQRPFELATVRLKNMVEVLGHWQTYVPDVQWITQRGGTFLFDSDGTLIYEHRDRGILGFAENMSRPLSFLASLDL
ncbi:peroxiredoxin-like family protein [Alkalinema pantanalense CENA528]|uniref:peroxiredoxin-like family protein n=1 Tax=Alkalinema pantanalense TaxID=1620705 RepID=UPI003D6EA967